MSRLGGLSLAATASTDAHFGSKQAIGGVVVVGSMPLHFAAEAGHADVVALLLRHGAPVESRTSAGATPLILAAKHLDLVRLVTE